MFNFFKEKMGLTTFVYQHFLPLIEWMVKSECDLLHEDVTKNNPPIKLGKDQLNFETFLLFLNASGRGLSRIKGFDKQVFLNFWLITDEILKKQFEHIKLNSQWIDKERGIVFSDIFNYYKSKMNAYHEVEFLYNKGDISEEDLRKKVSEIFFSLEADKINEPLITAVGELHKGGFLYLFKKLSVFSKKYQIVLDN